MWSVLKQKVLGGAGKEFDENQEKNKERVNKELLEKSKKRSLKKEEGLTQIETTQLQTIQELSTEEIPQTLADVKIECYDGNQEQEKALTTQESLEKKEEKYAEIDISQLQQVQELSTEKIYQEQREQHYTQTKLYEKAGARPKVTSGTVGKKIEKRGKKQPTASVPTESEIEEQKKAEVREAKQEEKALQEALSKLKLRPVSCVERMLSYYDEEKKKDYQELANMVQTITPNDINVKSTKCIGNTDPVSGKMYVSCNRDKSLKVEVKGDSLFIVNCRLSNKYLSENSRVNCAFPPKTPKQRKRKAIVYCFVDGNNTSKFLETCTTTSLSSYFLNSQCPFNFCNVKYVHFYTKHQNNKNLDLSDEKEALECFGGLTNVEFIDSRSSPSSSLSSSPSTSGSSSSHSSSPTESSSSGSPSSDFKSSFTSKFTRRQHHAS
ncbi:DUF3023 domain-containing protein [Ehrlichia canis]|uniref:Uncharacterized protein n=1 Tax=Ehrlichia canis (strain Jake) TaxID=269484 RepID=A0ACA6AVQ8_EHRCJ|nr:DUF3023 domain-containing protein [Ehrlichia canis]AAZ68473.1 hypothetical protein Ecaj_0431 [Ehrlichia canis str. Jake]AUO54777.1 DUF3023 domain-containing protein [Ehrlichia canis]UKC53157.1 DUF3023 domain-containing protein [Ehrlichia canis]UKC54094.1 DUF3023 domain-containing protein [Ehrlichia canis]UKC55030.1 DUF3023 domain-containing protein [Ehrlichia canis]